MPHSRPGPDTIAALRALIGFDTTSRNSNLPLIGWAEEWLTRHGARCERLPDETGQKATLWATFGPEGVRGWVLSGHTDTVPVDGQDWTLPSHEMTERDGRFYGRGACDMKGFLACCLGMAPQMAATPLQVPIHLALSYDEEVGCLGVRPLLRRLAAQPVRPLACIVGEPTQMQVAIGHKSKRSLRATVTGTPGHSSRAPEFVNAVEYGARLVVKMQEIGRRLARGATDPQYDTPHSTAHVGTAQGGIALNVVPELFTMDFEFRTIAADDPDALVAEIEAYARDTLLPEMRATDPRADIRIDLRAGFPGVDTAPDAPVTQAAQRFARHNDLTKVAYGTEGGLFQHMAGIPTVVCGPGSIAEAHRPDEFVEASQLALCEDFLRRLIEDCR